MHQTAMGAVLAQVQKGKERVICYWSRQLTKPEHGYSTTEKEALAAVLAVKEFYPYVYGFPFKLITDHNPLTSLKGLKDFGGRLTRWMLFLQQFNFQFEYKQGVTHSNADALSRIPPAVPAPPVVTIIHEWTGSIDSLRDAQGKDLKLSPVIKALTNDEPLPPTTAPGLRKAFIHDGLLYCHFCRTSTLPTKTQLIIPDSMKDTMLQQLHDQAGHLGISKTTEKVKARFYWPGYEQDIQNWISSCQQCQKRNPPQPAPRAPLGTIKTSHPFEKLSWDIMGPLPTSSKGYQYILVVTDLFSKWVEAFPLHATDSETLARILVDEIVCRYGVPVYLHSDQGANLNSQVILNLYKQLGINHTRTTAYHPQGNGQVERFNCTLESMLSKVVNENQKDWDIHLPKALFAYRTTIHDSTGYSPFHVNFGRSPSLPIDIMLGQFLSSDEEKEVAEYVKEVALSLKDAYEKVRHNIEEAHKANKRRYDDKESGDRFSIGDLVWLHVPAIKQGRTKKFSNLWRGPYTVIDKTSNVNYKIQLVDANKPLIVHRNRLKLCYGKPPWKTTSKLERATPPKEKQSTQCRTPTRGALIDRTFAEVVATPPTVHPAGYTSTNDIGENSRPQRNRRPPDRYRP